MKRIVAIYLAVTLLLSGCSSGPPDESTQESDHTKIFNASTSYFDNFTSEKSDATYTINGRVHNENDGNAIITYISAEKDVEISITGNMKKNSGADIELVYVAPNGDEIEIADNSTETFDVILSAVAGDGTVKFKGETAVYDFEVQFEILDEVTYSL